MANHVLCIAIATHAHRRMQTNECALARARTFIAFAFILLFHPKCHRQARQEHECCACTEHGTMLINTFSIQNLKFNHTSERCTQANMVCGFFLRRILIFPITTTRIQSAIFITFALPILHTKKIGEIFELKFFVSLHGKLIRSCTG